MQDKIKKEQVFQNAEIQALKFQIFWLKDIHFSMNATFHNGELLFNLSYT